MEDKKKVFVAVIAIVIMLILIGTIVRRALQVKEENESFEVIEETDRDTLVGKQAEKVTGYHLVTYAQTSNEHSFIKNLEVEVASEGPVKFVIGSINENSRIEERMTFELNCKQGKNTFDLLNNRYMLKKGEYLFMDVNGQDTLYKEEGVYAKSLVQSESNRVLGEIPVRESDYLLPFSYTLEKADEYRCLVIGNEITTNANAQGLNATDMEYDYFHLTKTRLENIFEKVTMNSINLVNWEKSLETEVDKNILKSDNLKNLDLVIIQLGENLNVVSDFETKMENLLGVIKEYSPHAEMIWISGWNMQGTVLNTIPAICEREQVQFMNIADLYETDYQSLVDEQRLIYYPNNEAMQTISNRLMEILKFDF